MIVTPPTHFPAKVSSFLQTKYPGITNSQISIFQFDSQLSVGTNKLSDEITIQCSAVVLWKINLDIVNLFRRAILLKYFIQLSLVRSRELFSPPPSLCSHIVTTIFSSISKLSESDLERKYTTSAFSASSRSQVETASGEIVTLVPGKIFRNINIIIAERAETLGTGH